VHTLNATAQTVHIAHFSSELKPVLTIDDGDTVVLESLRGDPAEYEAAGIAPQEIPRPLRDLYRDLQSYKGHELTGPIYVRGAEPGDVLEVHIREIRLTMPFGFNANVYGTGTLPEDFPYTSWRVIRMDLEKMISEVIPGVVVPLQPFFGVMGVAPPARLGKISSAPPGVHGGNIDLKDLGPGSILYLPVHIRGALFSAGDGHAVQGDGEVCYTAIETSMTGTFQFRVRKGVRLKWPRAETPTHIITMGLNEDLDVAARMALREMIEYLGEARGIKPEQAYMLSSLAVDLRITQLVNTVKGVHAMLAKSLFTGGRIGGQNQP
jgi:acetamidase/formamidase